MTLRDLLQLLVSGKETQFSICFVEGSVLKEYLVILERAPYMKHDLQGATTQTLGTKLDEAPDGMLNRQFYPDTCL